jgi:transposase InsO family protein
VNHKRDFVMARTQDGRPLKMLTVVDEYTLECLAIAVRRRLTSREVQEVWSELFLLRGCPTHIRSDNGAEFIARTLRALYRMLSVAPLFSESGSLWENGYVEAFNGKFLDELLKGELFCTLHQAQCSLNAGEGTTTPTAHIVRWGIGHPPQKPHGHTISLSA